ncbi:MAG: hypothetical protein HRT41_12880 [Campylobacteraceae bacterium]|nr:hypothetical protein [Campylobacteraceae bacterium]
MPSYTLSLIELLFTLIIFSFGGVIVGILIKYEKDSTIFINIVLVILSILVVLALTIGLVNISICSTASTSTCNFTISDILVGLAALLATASMIKYILNTNRIEKENKKRDLHPKILPYLKKVELCKTSTRNNASPLFNATQKNLDDLTKFSEEILSLRQFIEIEYHDKIKSFSDRITYLVDTQDKINKLPNTAPSYLDEEKKLKKLYDTTVEELEWLNKLLSEKLYIS